MSVIILKFENFVVCVCLIKGVFYSEFWTTLHKYFSAFLAKIRLFFQKYSEFKLFNPWNHRADILAQAYLKPSKKGKKMSPNCFFQTHYKEFCGDSEKNTHLFFGYLSRKLRGVDFLRFFAEVLLPDKLFRN